MNNLIKSFLSNNKIIISKVLPIKYYQLLNTKLNFI